MFQKFCKIPRKLLCPGITLSLVIIPLPSELPSSELRLTVRGLNPGIRGAPSDSHGEFIKIVAQGHEVRAAYCSTGLLQKATPRRQNWANLMFLWHDNSLLLGQRSKDW